MAVPDAKQGRKPNALRTSPLRTVALVAQPVADLAERLAGHLGSVEAALEFMRSFPGCVIQVPEAAAIVAYVRDQAARPGAR